MKCSDGFTEIGEEYFLQAARRADLGAGFTAGAFFIIDFGKIIFDGNCAVCAGFFTFFTTDTCV